MCRNHGIFLAIINSLQTTPCSRTNRPSLSHSTRPRYKLTVIILAGDMVISSNKYDVQLVSKSLFETRMTVVVRNFLKEDVGSYKCIAKNSLGEVESSIRLYGKLIKSINFCTRLGRINCKRLQKFRDRQKCTYFRTKRITTSN